MTVEPEVAAIRGDRAYALDPQVALRPEPFGALAYHYGNRRLTFLRSPELVALVESLGGHPSLDDALAAIAIAEHRWPAFRSALASLVESEVVRGA
ncbi:MAG: mycofactocin biosynthesis chaperone MftB [Acidimicrobiales bacterium]